MATQLHLPEEIDTHRLRIRRWAVADAAALKALIESSLTHLRPWLPWVDSYPAPVEVIEERIRHWRTQFDAGADWMFAISLRDTREVVGGIGLHRRGSADMLEIGYWLGAGKTGFGYATEAAHAMTTMALNQPGVTTIRIRCDPKNVRSAAVPRRLGYLYVTTVSRDAVTPPAPHDSMVWEITRPS
ncbi:MAG: GNAT family N-acetyltransferase [Acidobacteria bacterium]|nr:GNAT family N-acetyltransferase [Acidobacteriota bacterium]